jgi:hypothetical protein
LHIDFRTRVAPSRICSDCGRNRVREMSINCYTRLVSVRIAFLFVPATWGSTSALDVGDHSILYVKFDLWTSVLLVGLWRTDGVRPLSGHLFHDARHLLRFRPIGLENLELFCQVGHLGLHVEVSVAERFASWYSDGRLRCLWLSSCRCCCWLSSRRCCCWNSCCCYCCCCRNSCCCNSCSCGSFRNSIQQYGRWS